MSWRDRVPCPRITCKWVRDGTADEVIRDVLSEAMRDPAFPRLPPVTVPPPDPWWPDRRWVHLPLLTMVQLGAMLDGLLDPNETILGLLVAALLPGGPLVGADMIARPGIRMALGSRAQTRLRWGMSYRLDGHGVVDGRMEAVVDAMADPDPRPLDMYSLVRFGSRNLWDLAKGIYEYTARGAYYGDLSFARRRLRTAADTMLAGLPGGSEDNTQQGEQT